MLLHNIHETIICYKSDRLIIITIFQKNNTLNVLILNSSAAVSKRVLHLTEPVATKYLISWIHVINAIERTTNKIGISQEQQIFWCLQHLKCCAKTYPRVGDFETRVFKIPMVTGGNRYNFIELMKSSLLHYTIVKLFNPTGWS